LTELASLPSAATEGICLAVLTSPSFATLTVGDSCGTALAELAAQISLAARSHLAAASRWATWKRLTAAGGLALRLTLSRRPTPTFFGHPQ
jgi:hypothetical protein